MSSELAEHPNVGDAAGSPFSLQRLLCDVSTLFVVPSVGFCFTYSHVILTHGVIYVCEFFLSASQFNTGNMPGQRNSMDKQPQWSFS
jgi:hypothetical protein